MAPRGFGSRHWNCSKSWQPSCRCHAPTWCAMAAVWRPTAACAVRSSPRQQGVGEEETETEAPCWSWARLLKRVFAVDMARCPLCQEGSLRIIAASTHGEVIRKILRHLKL